MSPVHAFLTALRGDGHVPVTVPAPLETGPEMERMIRELDAACREEASGEAPPLHLPAAQWALTLTHRICQFLVWRDAGEEIVRPAFLVPCPAPQDAVCLWSVDLFFRYLPELHRLAVRLAPGDVLVREITNLSTAWPLAAPGITIPEKLLMPPGDGSPPPRSLLPQALQTHATLRRLLTDRVIACRERAWLGDPVLAAEIAAALGAWPDLCPELASDADRTPA